MSTPVAAAVLALTLGTSLGLGCAPNAPTAPVTPSPSSTASTASTASSESSTATDADAGIKPRGPIQAPNVEALKRSLAAAGYDVQVQASKEGQVTILDFMNTVPDARPPHEQLIAIMKAHGDQLGFGALGDVSLGGSSGLVNPVGSMLGWFHQAAACELYYEAGFETLAGGANAPRMWARRPTSTGWPRSPRRWRRSRSRRMRSRCSTRRAEAARSCAPARRPIRS